jgi:hypothetical protein
VCAFGCSAGKQANRQKQENALGAVVAWDSVCEKRPNNVEGTTRFKKN